MPYMWGWWGCVSPSWSQGSTFPPLGSTWVVVCLTTFSEPSYYLGCGLLLSFDSG